MNDLQKLKYQWELDPCWDIEDTEGFEDYYDHLLEYRQEKEVEREQERISQLQQEAKEYGLSPQDYEAMVNAGINSENHRDNMLRILSHHIGHDDADSLLYHIDKYISCRVEVHLINAKRSN